MQNVPEEARNNALLEASSHDDGVVLAIGERFHPLREPIESLGVRGDNGEGKPIGIDVSVKTSEWRG